MTTRNAPELYLDLLKRVLCRYGFDQKYRDVSPAHGPLRTAFRPVQQVLGTLGYHLVKEQPVDLAAREGGLDWPAEAESMMGLKRMDNLQQCATTVIKEGVPGDFIETGVWRGGGTIFMRGILEALGDTGRRVWVADSFQGLPKPDAERYPADKGDETWRAPQLAVSVDQVKANFARYGLLDERVQFLVGWFKDTLPTAPIAKLAVMRLDGDLYESTMDAFTALYPKLSVGGYVIVDDYHAYPACKEATHDYRAANGISDEIVPIDTTGVYWRRTR